MDRSVATWPSSSRLELMSRHHVDVATWATVRKVATSCGCRDMGGSG